LEREKVLIVSESALKSSTILNLLQSVDVSPLQMVYDFSVATCPDTITYLSQKRLSPRPTPRQSSELDFNETMKSALHPTYEIVNSAATVDALRSLQHKILNTSRLIVAFNADKRGEALTCDLLSTLNIPKEVVTSRLKLPEITPGVLRKTLSSALFPTPEHTGSQVTVINMNAVNSQITQRVLDRTLSFTLAQALHKSLGDYFSAGRVQSHALQLIVEVRWSIACE
jgi:DNA topoisomerase IA